MTILVVPDGFKDSLSSLEVGEAMCKGILSFDTSIKAHSIYASDGGDGFLNAIQHYKPNLKRIETKTVDPLGRNIIAHYLYDEQEQTAFIELAAASGIELLSKQERRVIETSTLGTGLQMLDAMRRGAKRMYIGLGGSATNDAGTGLASVLGYRFFDRKGNQLAPCGKNLALIAKINKESTQLDAIDIVAVNDVQNPLFGPNGAAYTYAAQKGASPAQIEQLDKGLKQLHKIVLKDFGKDAASLKGAGAAGGTAYGLHIFLNATFTSGSKFILSLSQFYEFLEDQKVDFILTGEGCIDHQSKHGKLIMEVIEQGRQRNIPVMAVCGKLNLASPEWQALGLRDVRELYNPNMPVDYSYTHAAQLIVQATIQLLTDNN